MIIIYKSNTGYTEQYAKLLSEQLGLPCYKLGSVPECHKGRDAIYLGWLFAGNIVGYKTASKKYHLRCVCGVGMGPPVPELVPGFRDKMGIPDSVQVFYLQGGFDINKLKGPMKLIMKVKCKEIAGRLNVRAELSPEEQATLRMTQTGASCVSRENLAEVVAWYK